jgi:hypothetical protein
MVKKWEKQLEAISKSDCLELQSIVDNILKEDYD